MSSERDIVDRLRGPTPSIPAMRDAAAEIERLRSRVDVLEVQTITAISGRDEDAAKASHRIAELEKALEEVIREVGNGSFEDINWIWELQCTRYL
jgi:hypothetical protein